MGIILVLGYNVIAICVLIFSIKYGEEDGLTTFMGSLFWPILLIVIIVMGILYGINEGIENLIKKYRKK